MGKLIFIGLGLGDEGGITFNGFQAAKASDFVLMENYTSMLEKGSVQKLEYMMEKPIVLLDRETVEGGDKILEYARQGQVAFLVPGDAMSATTHVDLRLRAIEAGIPTEIIHGVSIFTAVPGLLGLQNYKFGRTVTIPFRVENFLPTSFYYHIKENMDMGLHTLCLLDIKQDEGRFMTASEALGILSEIEVREKADVMVKGLIVCVIARAGSKDVKVRAGRVSEMILEDMGGPLHCIVIPGKLHFMEAKALVELAGAPSGILEK